MNTRTQILISVLLFLFSPLCLLIGYKKTEGELSKLDEMLVISLRKNIFLEDMNNTLLLLNSSEEPSPAALQQTLLKLNDSYRIYINAIRTSALSPDIIVTETHAAQSAYGTVSQYNAGHPHLLSYTGQDYKMHSLTTDILRQSFVDNRRIYWFNLFLMLSIPLLLAFMRTIYQVYITRSYAVLKKDFYTDTLTQVHNRNYIKKILKSGGFSHLIMVDVDDFKSINDIYGHLAGDQVLITLAWEISSAVRHGDVIVRFGGDEFVVFLKNATQEGARKVAERIQRVHQNTLSLSEGLVISMPSVSLGVARFSGSFTDTLQMADDAIYKVKTQGKGKMRYEE